MPSYKTYQHLSDEELIMRFHQTADNFWLGCLFQRHTLLLIGIAHKYMKDAALAEDAVQQVFLKALQSFPQEPIKNVKGWLYILTRNHCLQQLRQHHPYQSIEPLEDHSPAEESETLVTEANLHQMEQALEALSPEQRQSIVLFYLKKYSYEQIITHTGYTYLQVKSYIQNGKRNLKALLQHKIKQH